MKRLKILPFIIIASLFCQSAYASFNDFSFQHWSWVGGQNKSIALGGLITPQISSGLAGTLTITLGGNHAESLIGQVGNAAAGLLSAIGTVDINPSGQTGADADGTLSIQASSTVSISGSAGVGYSGIITGRTQIGGNLLGQAGLDASPSTLSIVATSIVTLTSSTAQGLSLNNIQTQNTIYQSFTGQTGGGVGGTLGTSVLVMASPLLTGSVGNDASTSTFSISTAGAIIPGSAGIVGQVGAAADGTLTTVAQAIIPAITGATGADADGTLTGTSGSGTPASVSVTGQVGNAADGTLSIVAQSYFGYTTIGGTQDQNGMMWLRSDSAQTFTCPGTGTRVVHELSMYAMGAGTNTQKFRLAIYTTAGALVCQGTSDVTPANTTTPSWQGHMTQASITPNPCNLTGGTVYTLGWAIEPDVPAVDQMYEYYDVGSGSESVWINSVDYATSGWPATLTDSGTTSDTGKYSIRVGVQ